MAKVAKKGASSAKKSGATKKVVAKKVEKQKKTAVKASSSTSKKKEEKKVVPAKKAVAKKVAGKAKVAAKKPVSKPVAKKAVSKVPAKPSKVAPKAKTASKPVAKKSVPVRKASSPPSKAVKAIKEPEVKKKAPVAVAKPAVAAPISTPVEKTPAKPRRAKKKKDDDDDDEEVVVFRKPAKTSKSSSKKSSAKYVSEELTLEGPAPTRIGPIVMSSEEKLKLKKALLLRCIEIQKSNVSLAKKAMEDALSSANEEKVSEELSDSFRESMHATRDMYARQAQEGINNLGLLNRIMVQEHDKVKFGSVVFTNFQNYFISTSLGEIKIEDKGFQTVSTLSPLFQILADKKKGDTFMFLDRLYTVIEVF